MESILKIIQDDWKSFVRKELVDVLTVDLDEALDWIRNNLTPEQVFEPEVLIAWGEEAGLIVEPPEVEETEEEDEG